MMKILVLGGTKFLGRHIVEAALKNSHEITLFNRGKENPELFPHLETIIGDRDGSLEQLKNRYWDAVIDTSGYVPRIVKKSVDILFKNVDHYTFISTISVYKDYEQEGIDESYGISELTDESVEEMNGESYGALKALCEKEVMTKLPNKSLVIRPGLIVGPYDPSDRFTYWPYRMNKGGRVLAPGIPDRPAQFIDVRDLSKWIVRMVEKKETGIYNATGVKHQTTVGEVLSECNKRTNSIAELVWVDDEFLIEQEVAPFSDLPLWLPGSKEYVGFQTINVDKAVSRGLLFRPFQETIIDTLDWLKKENIDEPLKAGLTQEKEVALLTKWESK